MGPPPPQVRLYRVACVGVVFVASFVTVAYNGSTHSEVTMQKQKFYPRAPTPIRYGRG